ncbi:MAG: HEAT repeat domain-containing protein, partial [Chloroflexi bacterium]|nr:HEAT repeat domain-containing protein [Chloroflexota bacterium]
MRELSGRIADLASGDDQRAEGARVALELLGSAALPALLRLAQSPSPDHRWWAMRCLSDHHHERADQVLIDGLHDPDPSVRQAAALALRDRPMATAIPRLVSLLGDEDSLLSRLASDALVAMGSAATPALAEALQLPSATARIGAARALALNLDSGAIPALFAALEDASGL